MKTNALTIGIGMIGMLVANGFQASVRPTHVPAYQVHFSIRNAGMAVKGTLSGVEANISFDPQDVNRSYVQAMADPATIRTGIDLRDKHLQKPDYFDAGAYPRLTLVSRSFRRTGRHQFAGQFDLTIKNTTKTVIIPFSVTRTGNGNRYDGCFTINRLDFGLGEKSVILDEKVTITVRANVP